MNLALKSAALLGLAVSAAGIPALAQSRDTNEKSLTCENGGYDSQRARHCEMREQTVASIGHLNIDASPNGGATIKGWTRSDTLVRARIEGSGDTEAAASLITSQVLIDSSGGQVRATGPDSANNSGWSVSYEIFVPLITDLNLKTVNGAITIADVRGQIHFDVNNGGVHLKRVSGDVSGATVNGGIQVDLAGTVWDGRQLEVSTRNGGVTLTMPASYSAHLQAETSSGGIQSDLPVTVDGNQRPRKLDTNLGSGGPLIHVTTVNGQVRLKKAE